MLLYLRHWHHVQRDFLSISPWCWHVSSSTRNNCDEQFLEPAFYTLIENKYVSTYGNAYLINM
jgi:hypothetical protein